MFEKLMWNLKNELRYLQFFQWYSISQSLFSSSECFPEKEREQKKPDCIESYVRLRVVVKIVVWVYLLILKTIFIPITCFAEKEIS